jgi:hypothetical protein
MMTEDPVVEIQEYCDGFWKCLGNNANIPKNNTHWNTLKMTKDTVNYTTNTVE